MQTYIHIGKIVATHGVGGELVVTHQLGGRQAFKNLKAVFIEETKGSYIPYFISKATAKSEEEALLQLEEISSKEQARRFVKKNIWLAEEDFTRAADKNAPISLLGYAIFDDKVLLGQVTEVIEQPHQVLLKTMYKEKEALLPVHAETLISIDRTKKEVHLRLPEGLLEIYLEN